MRQYELTIRIAQIHHLIEVRKYKKALAVVKTLDMRQVKGISDLSAIAEVYTKTEQFDAAKNTYLRIYKKSRTRRVLYRLIYLAIRTNALDEAEGYYQEFVEMNSSQRDALILRYRIDKASGAPVGQLIGILESLKEEEYIEEWAYELAKLYFKAGRFDECRSECEDIKLWFGKGEIVERAKRLIDSIDDDEQLAYIDDRDYTVENEVPNPDDTGSLPDLTEYVESEISLQHENSIAKKVKEAIRTGFEDDGEFDDTFGDYYDNEDESSEYERDEAVDELLSMDNNNYDEEKSEGVQSIQDDNLTDGTKLDENIKSEPTDDSLFDEEDEAEDFDGAEMARRAIDGLQKLSGLWKHQPKEQHDNVISKEDKEPQQHEEKPMHSQSGTGITQDLSKEISAIYEAERRQQLKVHSVKVNDNKVSQQNKQVEKIKENSVISRQAAMAPSDIEEIKNDLKDITGNIFGEKKRRIVGSVADDWGHTKPIGKVVEEVNNTMNAQEMKVSEESRVNINKLKIQEGINMADYSIPEDELPTTRALHKTFTDVLTLIGAEKDPSHFVLIGEDNEKIVAVSKKIVKVIKANGFLSKGRIACIQAKQLNMMDFDAYREHLKGSCLLVDDAADLYFPTITKIFELMDEFYGDFMVILADEGNTLDQMFRFAPALAKKFKYVIDVSRYTAEDLE